MLGSDGGIISSLPSLPKPMLRICTSHQSQLKKQTRTLKNRTNDSFGAYCLRFHQLNCLQLTLNNPQSRMPEISRRSHSFEQKKKNKYIEHGAEDLLGASLSEILPSLVRSAHLCSMFENLTFFVRS
jgi:hypothetical protein